MSPTESSSTAVSTKTSTDDIIQSINKQLEQAKSEGAHILAALTIQSVPPMHKPVVVMVTLSPKPSDKEVYQGKGGLNLTAIAHKKIGGALGIRWIPKDCRRLDDGHDPNYVAYRMVGMVKELDGTWRTLMGDKEIRMETVIEELTDNYKQRAIEYMNDPKDGPAFTKAFPTEADRATWVREKVRVDALQIKKHMLARAQTGAMARAIKSVGFKETYTAEELQKPFVFPKLVFEADPTNPEDRRFLLASASGAIDNLYPAEAATQAQEGRSALPPDEEHSDADIIDIPSMQDKGPAAEAAAAIGKTARTAKEAAAQPSLPKEESARLDFQASDPAEQVKTLEGLIVRKAYKGKLHSPIPKWPAEVRLAFFDKLVALETPTTSTEPALPFE